MRNQNPLGTRVRRHAVAPVPLWFGFGATSPLLAPCSTAVPSRGRRVPRARFRRIGLLRKDVTALLALGSEEETLQPGQRDSGCGEGLENEEIGRNEEQEDLDVGGGLGRNARFHPGFPRLELRLAQRDDLGICGPHAAPSLMRKSATSG